MPDHIHILIGLRPTQSISNLLQDIKGDSSRWINENRLVMGRFSWQEGYGAFSYKKSDLNRVIDYIKLQEEHHLKLHFLEEYKDLLNEFEVEYDERYIFREVE